jgi:hypothetical protein
MKPMTHKTGGAAAVACSALVRHHVNLLLNRQVLNSSMLHPSQTPTRAAIGGFSAPNDENQIRNAMQAIQSNIRTAKPAKFLGRVARKPNKAEIITNASPVKNDPRPLIAKSTRPTISKVWPTTNLMSVFFIARP